MPHRNHPQRRGTIFVLALAVTGFLSPAQAADDFPPLFPFLISYDGPDNASSMAHLLDAPAGKHGFIRAQGSRFVNDAGPIRLHATNLTGSANSRTSGSKQFGELSQGGHRLRESLPFEGCQEFLDGRSWPPEALTLALGGDAHGLRRQVQQMGDEFVRMLSVDAVRRERCVGEVVEIVSHDHISTGPDGGGQHVAVIRIGQAERRDQVLVSADKAVPHMGVHQLPRTFQLLSSQIGPLLQYAANPLVVDLVRPLRAEQVGERQMHEQVTQWSRIEHAGVEQRSEVSHVP